MARRPDFLRRVSRAAEARRRSELREHDARARYRAALQAARDAGHTFTEIAEAAGISRQAARQLLARERER